MVQLTLIPDASTSTLVREVDRLCAEAHAKALAEVDIRAAARTTGSRFESWSGRGLDAAERARVRAYFLAVLRRRMLSSSDPSAIAGRQRLVTASIEADLRAGGWSACRAAREALRLTGQAG